MVWGEGHRLNLLEGSHLQSAISICVLTINALLPFRTVLFSLKLSPWGLGLATLSQLLVGAIVSAQVEQDGTTLKVIQMFYKS